MEALRLMIEFSLKKCIMHERVSCHLFSYHYIETIPVRLFQLHWPFSGGCVFLKPTHKDKNTGEMLYLSIESSLKKFTWIFFFTQVL